MKISTLQDLCIALLMSIFTCNVLQAQTTFSRFDFNAAPYTTATIGPNATSIDPDVIGNGSAAYIANNCGANKGLDLRIPNLAGLFDKPEMGMTFRFRKLETQSDFFVRGGLRFYQTNGMLYIGYQTENGSGGFSEYGPYNTGYALLSDGLFHTYTFVYLKSTGVARVSVDGIVIWTMNGPDNLGLYWVGAPNPIVGTTMDGNCSSAPFLDYAFFFVPTSTLAVEFQSFTASAIGNDAKLSWTAAHQEGTQPYQVERSLDGSQFEVVAEVAQTKDAGAQRYSFIDPAPGTGTIFYRIRQQSNDGEYASTNIETVTLVGDMKPSLEVWPNPSTNDAVEVLLKNFEGPSIVTVTDLGGRQVLATATQADATLKLDISSLTPGLYILSCDYAGKRLMQKLLVQ